MLKKLFSPVKVGFNNLQHRVVLCPLTRFRSLPGSIPSDLQAKYYEQRASEGGLLITEATLVSPFAGGYPRAPGIYNKEQIEGWRKVTSAVHEKKGVIFSQLWHVGRVGTKFLNPNQDQVVSASDVPVSGKNAQGIDYEIPRPLEIDEIKAIIKDFAQAAKNAIEAGFDGVELHGANGYLIDQFTNSSSNKRTDIYGGSIKNRSRFALEAVDAVVEAIGAERTAIRFSPGNSYQEMADDTVVDTWSYLTSQLQERHPDLAYVHFMEADAFTKDELVDTLEPYRKLWKGPFITANGYSDAPKKAIEIAENTGDLIAFGRAFIANPDLPERLRQNQELNQADYSTFYTNEAAGYTDYPFYEEAKKN
ncbi:hypothetical protein INT46_003882 [Mucor plumbeus]|uniref:NADH:flavin oxidoreductase/NADH oxidase N-terminal domain-containing protein n=1 Tax=Mucor plumbeus TaxID=97098 RepID=A0A8H7UZ96_9FUNG|nr:hypothetical protein INT46_003882 [Mucor plumbeus]